ncbi:tetratricopeptide repeat protein [Saccharothrix stipae]
MLDARGQVERVSAERRRVDEVRVSRTGDAIASAPGAVAISGVGTVQLTGAPPARSDYRHQIARIAKTPLRDREAELAELAAFCADADENAPAYRWWRAPKWSGKTLLMAHFALQPPPDVRIVAFFVTARLAGNDTRAAFVDVVGDQLAEILGEPSPTTLPRHVSDSYLNGLLTRAAQACRERGERLVLLVDGLDEDRGTPHDQPVHGTSIAAALPTHPPAGMRIVVSGRPNPQLPADVPPDHPLRDPSVARPLARSPHAEVAEDQMLLELNRLLHAGPVERDLLGLVTAALGGLTADDLAKLTKRPAADVRRLLRGVTARTLDTRGGHWRPDTEVYLLGHEDLHAIATAELGESLLGEYRQRLHDWAEHHRDLRWPAETPEYLLRGYFAMVRANGLTSHMVACATDPHRRDRMLDLSGGDVDGISEITATQEVIATGDRPDLCAMVRLAIHLDHVTNRNSNIPPVLPAVWVGLGHVDRAESIAYSIVDPTKRLEALTAVAAATAESGDRDRASRLLDQAEQLAHTMADGPDSHANALARVAGAAAEAGDPDRAEHIARTIADHPHAYANALVRMAGAVAEAGDVERAEEIALTIADHPHAYANALVRMAGAVAEAGDVERAERIAHTISDDRYWWAKAMARIAGAAAGTGEFERAERIARTIADSPDPHARADALARVAAAAAEAGDPARATRLIHEAKQLARSIREPHNQANALEWVAEALVKAGDLDGAEQIARTVTYPPHQTKALARLAEAVAAAGQVDRAEQIARTITVHDPYSKAEALARVAGVVAEAGDAGRATRLLHDAEQVARTITPRRAPVEALARVAGMIAEAGAFERAERIADTITSSHWRATALARIAGAVAEAGHVDRAEWIALTITDADHYWKAEAVARVAAAVAKTGDVDRAGQIADTVDHESSPVNVLARVAEAVAGTGDVDRAEQIARTAPRRQAEALARVAGAAAEVGAVDRAEDIARSMADGYWLAGTLARVAGAVAEAGESSRAARLLDDAERVARNITQPYNRVNVLTRMAEAAAKAGDRRRATRLLDDAERVARAIGHPYSQADALTRVASAVAETGDVDRAERMARAITADRSHRTEALVALAGNRSVPRREHLVVDVLRLPDWQLSVDVLVELAPAALEVVLAELATVEWA